MIDVMFYEAFKEEQISLKKLLPKNIKAGFTDKTIQECTDKDPPARLISVRTQSHIPLNWAQKLDGIFSRTRGEDHLTRYLEKAKANIICGSLPPYCSRAVAEHAIMAMLILIRRLKEQIKNFEAFDRNNLTGIECMDRNALVIGVGNIGSEIVDIARGLRMQVRGVDIVERFKDVQYISLEKGVAWADVIFSAVPVTEITKGMLNYKLLKKMRKGASLINISRGEISPISDLKKLLDEEILGGLNLDVYEKEGSLADYLHGTNKNADATIQTIIELKNRDNVLFTPHNAFNTSEALQQKAKLSAEAITIFLQTKSFG